MNSASCNSTTTDYHLHTVCMVVIKAIKEDEIKEITFTVQNVKHFKKAAHCQHDVKPQPPW